MIDNEITYAAVITLELPGMAEPATVTVTLTPADAVETATGRAKLLRDCTLADLEAFAGALEEEIWARYQAQQLIRLAEDEKSQVKISVLEAGDQPKAPGGAWLEHAIILPDAPQAPPPNAKEKTAPTGSPSRDAAPTIEEETAGDVEEAPVAPGSVEAAPEEPAASVGEETGPATAEETEAAEVADQALPTDETEEPATEVTAPVTETEPVPVETPVVEGAEPRTALAAAREAAQDVVAPGVRILGLRRPVGHPTPAAVDILVNESAFREAQAHALSSLDREVAGMLIGPQPEKQPDGRYVVHISDTIIARHTRMAGASVTYTPESWRHVTDVLTERYPNEEAVIVGWYHTHPGFGIFLSGMDLFIHQNFFTQKWHVALVLDPRARRTGFFCWDRPQTAVQPYDFPWPPWASGSW